MSGMLIAKKLRILLAFCLLIRTFVPKMYKIMMHKERIFALMLFAWMAVSSHAQLKVGVTAGLNISQLRVSEDDYKGYVNKIRPGFVVGPTVIYTIPKTGLGFDLSALFDMRSAKSKDYDDCNTITCSSFQLPFNIRYGMEVGDMIHAFVFTGPQFGFHTGSKERLIVEGKGAKTGHALERRYASQSSNFSWNLGVGAVILEKLQVRISYNLAINKTGEIRQVDMVDGSVRHLTDVKASACQVVFSYLF